MKGIFLQPWKWVRFLWVVLLFICLWSCDGEWNNPYPKDLKFQKYLYTSFSARPKHLDPAQSYSSDESVFLAQIYEPPLQYHYLKRPYELVPLTAETMPDIKFYDKNGLLLSASVDPNMVAYTEYEISIKSGIEYQPHPALAIDAAGNYLYHHLTTQDTKSIEQLSDFAQMGTRELIAADYVYQIKRLANPHVNSPIASLMERYIVGFSDFSSTMRSEKIGTIDLKKVDISGVTVIDKYTYKIKIHGKYPPFIYWLSMSFFAPMPWEADIFYAQPQLIKKNIVLDWYPIGTGPYQLIRNDPNRKMVLARNPNFHPEFYPMEGEPGDQEKGLLNAAGKRLPFIEQIIFVLEKEGIPAWIKFLQGYYDYSGLSSDNYATAIQSNTQGLALTPRMQEKEIRLDHAVMSTTSYWGFNMDDPIVGGYTDEARKLRQAISIAIDVEEYIDIFLNGRGVAAMGPLPPGVTGYQSGEAGINPFVYQWESGYALRRPISDALQLLTEAGYPNGVNVKTGQPLVINYDVVSRGTPDEKAVFAWMQKQFDKLHIQLNIRATDYNRFREKMYSGYSQFFEWGWIADYPDPENFLLLLYHANPHSDDEVVDEESLNVTHYKNPEFDADFRQIEQLDNGEARMQIISTMQQMVRRDSPWVWGFHPEAFELSQKWNSPYKINAMANNVYKYMDLDPMQRAQLREQWNKPAIIPIFIVCGIFLLIVLVVYILYRRRENRPNQKRINM